MVEGERADMVDAFENPITGVRGIELAMLAEVVHDIDPEIPGDTSHTRVKLATDLEYCYARNKVTIYANVVRATHGESREETLGSGDGSKTLQQFALKQNPLTYVSAPTPSGVESTLKVFVDDVEWHEAESIFGLQPTARRFVTTRNDAEVTTVIFGNGKQGARLPTGRENVRAKYRQGLGKAGNVAEGKITLLAARPLSVKDVTNPRQASGGADPETRDQARRNAPLAVLALDRLVSTSDYADLARTFGGVGKAFSVRLSNGIREIVHVTIAGAGDVPIAPDSDVLRNLRSALTDFGDPALPVNVAVRELQLLVISAGVRLLPDYVWEKVAPQIRAKLLGTFSFETRELGQDVFLSEVMSAMQSVRGVAYVDVDAFGGIAERNDDGSVRTPNELIEASQLIVKKGRPDARVVVNLPELPRLITDPIRPAQLTYLVPEVPDTLIINLIE
jgi:predicted phage baseplate assembly protein